MAKKSTQSPREGKAALPVIETIFRVAGVEFTDRDAALAHIEKQDVEGRTKKLSNAIVGKAAARVRNDIRAGVEYLVRLALRDPAQARKLLDLESDVGANGDVIQPLRVLAPAKKVATPAAKKAAAPAAKKAQPVAKKAAVKRATVAEHIAKIPAPAVKKVAVKRAQPAPKKEAAPKPPELVENLDNLTPPVLPPDIAAASAGK